MARRTHGCPALARWEVRRTVVARCAIHVPEFRARLGDLQVGVPPPPQNSVGDSPSSRSRAPSVSTRAPVSPAWAERGQVPSSVCDARAARAWKLPGTLEPGRLILAERRIRGSHQRRDRESARPPRLHQGEPGPDRVVERSLHVAGDDRVPFLRRGAHRPRSIGATLDGGARRRSRSVDPAASRARSRAGDDPRGVRRQERPVRGDPRRARDVRLSPACHPPTRSRCTGGSSPVSTCRSTGRGSRSGSRRSPSPSPRHCSSSRSACGCAPGVGLVAALTTLHPYVVWHDVHANREVLDGLVLALLVLCTLLAYENRSLTMAAATGGSRGSRFSGTPGSSFYPSRSVSSSRARSASPNAGAAALVVVGAALVVAPWVNATRSRSAATRSRPMLARCGRRTTRPREACSTAGLDRRRPGAGGSALARAGGRPDARGHADVGRRMRTDALVPRRGAELLAREPARRPGSQRRRRGCSGTRSHPSPTRVAAVLPGPHGARSNRRSWSVSTSWRSRPLRRTPTLRLTGAPAARLQHARRDGVRRNCPLSRPWDFLLASSPRSHSQRSGSASDGDGLHRSGLAREVELLDARQHRSGGELRERARARRAPWSMRA